MKIARSAAPNADGEQQQEDEDHGGSGPVLKGGAQADAAVIEDGEEGGHGNAEEKAGQENRLAGNAIQGERIERRKDIGSDFSDGYCFPWADDEVGEEHYPAGEKTNNGRKNLRGVGGFAGGVGEPLDPLAVDVTDREKEESAEGEAQRGTKRAAAAEPIVHEHQPANTDHGAERESKVISDLKFAG